MHKNTSARVDVVMAGTAEPENAEVTEPVEDDTEQPTAAGAPKRGSKRTRATRP